jgi:hypothetical protein
MSMMISEQELVVAGINFMSTKDLVRFAFQRSDLNNLSGEIKHFHYSLFGPWLLYDGDEWPSQYWINAFGMRLDAFLFVATKRGDADAMRMYIAAGADPVVPTFDGDCAARLGTACGMFDVFNRPDWLNAKDKFGDTGLFRLARMRETRLIEKAVWMGGDLEVRNNRGHTVLDALDDHCDKESCARIRGLLPEYRASVLQNETRPATRSTIGSARNRL